jgi:hypothetical protein
MNFIYVILNENKEILGCFGKKKKAIDAIKSLYDIVEEIEINVYYETIDYDIIIKEFPINELV